MVEWKSAIVECPESVPPELSQAFANLVASREALLYSGFMDMIVTGKYPSKGWWIEEHIHLEGNTLTYAQRYIGPPAIKTPEELLNH